MLRGSQNTAQANDNRAQKCPCSQGLNSDLWNGQEKTTGLSQGTSTFTQQQATRLLPVHRLSRFLLRSLPLGQTTSTPFQNPVGYLVLCCG